jgi:phage-related protein
MAIQTLPLQSKITNQYSTSNKLKIREVSFGDGYKQISKVGINPRMTDISLSFVALSTDDKNTLTSFLDAQTGDLIAFTPLGESTPLSYYCKQYSSSLLSGNKWTINCVLTQFYSN